MAFANINTQERKDALPNVVVMPSGAFVTGADITHWAVYGWREVTQIENPASGYRVGSYLAVELTPLTCKLTIATSVNIAAEQATALDLQQSWRWEGKTPTHILTNDKFKSLL